MRYREYADALRAAHPAPLASAIHVVFYIQMPKSWSKKKKEKMSGMPHLQKPDIDNLVKAVLDPLAKEDQYIWHVDATKLWAWEPAIVIEPEYVAH